MDLIDVVDDAGPGRTACLNLYSRLAAGVSVVTVVGDDGATGMTASSVTSVSLRPPLLLVSVDSRSRTLAAVRSRQTFAVHLLRSDQRDLAERFATGGAARFAGLPSRNVLGAPVIPDVLAWSVCSLEAETPYGDHCLVIGRVAAAHVGRGRPLLWHDRGFGEFTQA
jgi:flavin reductase (DIM6/NTAB) family NADH-FMN oxidoreductase RutF